MDHLTTQAMGEIVGRYAPPRHNVLLLSCMDLRLIDQLASFMDRDNLTNRYDHLVCAGAALGILQTTFPSWRETFFDHLRIAIQLHDPKDVYVVEHRNCGAYRELLGLDFGDDPASQAKERAAHKEQVDAFARVIAEWCVKESEQTGKKVELRVRSFLMDLRGDVELLGPSEKRPEKKPLAAGKRAGRKR